MSVAVPSNPIPKVRDFIEAKPLPEEIREVEFAV
jgi:hypothetical protein